MARTAEIVRETRETRVRVRLDLDGTGASTVATGVGFFDHMLDGWARHAGFDLEVETQGDLHIDDHHTVEDTGIVMGQAFREACDGYRGVRRFGHAYVPMDEALVRCAVDLCGRAFPVWRAPPFPTAKVGTFDTELVREFHGAFSANALAAVHLEVLYGANSHHIAEACFKAQARALRMAVEPDSKSGGAAVSTKGVL